MGCCGALGWGAVVREGGVLWGVTSVIVSATAGVLEGGDEDIAIR